MAFLVLCHSDPRHLRRLLAALADAGHVFVHVDAKADPLPFHEAAAGFDVTFVEPRVRVRWGGLSVVRATMRLIEAALASGQAYTRLILLSGSCYPIRPLDDLRMLFEREPKREFIRLGHLHEAAPGLRERVSRYWLFDYIDVPSRDLTPVLMVKRLFRKLLHLALAPIRKDVAARLPGMILAHGSQWWALTPACAAYVLDVGRMRPDLWRFFATSFAPDELLVHSIVASSSFTRFTGEAAAPDEDHPASFANLHLIDRSLTKVYEASDFHTIVASGQFFVRKVNSSRSTALLDRIDEELLGRQRNLSATSDGSIAA